MRLALSTPLWCGVLIQRCSRLCALLDDPHTQPRGNANLGHRLLYTGKNTHKRYLLVILATLFNFWHHLALCFYCFRFFTKKMYGCVWIVSTWDHSIANQLGHSKLLQFCFEIGRGECVHFHSSTWTIWPCMSSSTHTTLRSWLPPPHETEHDVQGFCSHLHTHGYKETYFNTHFLTVIYIYHHHDHDLYYHQYNGAAMLAAVRPTHPK